MVLECLALAPMQRGAFFLKENVRGRINNALPLDTHKRKAMRLMSYESSVKSISERMLSISRAAVRPRQR